MLERVEQVATGGGAMETFIASPEDKPRGAVILYMDVWGMREELRSVAREVAANGYACFLPDLYYREGRVRHQFSDEQGHMRSLLSLTPEEQEQVRGPMRRLTDDMAMDDTRALLAQLGEEYPCIGAVGYCMGGRHALLAGGTFRGAIKVAACLHGSNLVNDTASSPHIIASRIAGEAYCGFAELDPFGSADVRERIEDQFARAGARLTTTVHSGAQHGYALPGRDVHDPAATHRDWTTIYAMLARAPA
jgi:carboxymethylenebutenolidase